MPTQAPPNQASQEEGSILFRSEDPSGSDAFRITVFMGTAAFSLAYLLSGRVSRPLELFAWAFILVFSSYFIANATYNVIRWWGKDLGGFLVDGDGVVDQSSWSGFGRVFWREIKAIDPVTSSFFGLPMRMKLIGIEVTDSYVNRRPTWIRFRIWMNRKVFKSPDLHFSSKRLKNSHERILRELQDRLREYELRSISEAKELESGN
jgi:hypothetical protein